MEYQLDDPQELIKRFGEFFKQIFFHIVKKEKITNFLQCKIGLGLKLSAKFKPTEIA